MGKLIVKGFLASELKQTEFGYYFSIAEKTGELKRQFHSCFISDENAEEMMKCKVKKGSLIEIIGIQTLSVYKKEAETEVNSKIKVIHWEFISVFDRVSKANKNPTEDSRIEKGTVKEIILEDEKLPF